MLNKPQAQNKRCMLSIHNGSEGIRCSSSATVQTMDPKKASAHYGRGYVRCWSFHSDRLPAGLATRAVPQPQLQDIQLLTIHSSGVASGSSSSVKCWWYCAIFRWL